MNKLSLMQKVFQHLEENVENTCELINFDAFYAFNDQIVKNEFHIYIVKDLDDKDYLEQLEMNLRLLADEVKKFKLEDHNNE